MIRSTRFPTRTRWTDAATARAWLADEYIPGLHRQARAFEQQQGRPPSDQDFPVELLRLVPQHPRHAPLLILGGMGPLAGAQALQAAIARLGDSREIVLLQWCCVPDRTRALNEDALIHGVSPLHASVVDSLAQGFAQGEAALETLHLGAGTAVVACNTAHNFAPDAFRRYQSQHARVPRMQLRSLVDGVSGWMAETRLGASPPVIVLGTDGTLRTRLYLQPLEALGMNCSVPAPEGQQALMAAIYQGVKAFDAEAVVLHGQRLMRQLESSGSAASDQPFVLLAACTEVPEIVTTLRDRGEPDVQAWLGRATVADPMGIVLDRLAREPSVTTDVTEPAALADPTGS